MLSSPTFPSALASWKPKQAEPPPTTTEHNAPPSSPDAAGLFFGDTMTTKKAKPVWAWDLETTNWDEVVAACAVSSDGDTIRYAGPDALARLSVDMDKAGGNWVAHAGGIFDTLLLLGVRPEPFKELILSGSAILTAKDRTLRVRDSFRWWLAGLGTVGKYLDKCDGNTGRYLKRDVDRARIDELTERERLDYCEHDCFILQAGIQKALAYSEAQNARPAWTSGANALNMLATLEPFSWALLDKLKLDEDTASAARTIVRGARVECWAHGNVDGVYVYDFKSAYPSAYQTDPLPIGARRVRPGERPRPGTIWRARWCWPWRDRLPPVLDASSNGGAGWCEAWCCPEELEDLDRAGVGVQLLEGWAPEAMAPVGQLFLRDLYTQKEAGSFFAKVYLNSLHGKFSENPIRETWSSGARPTSWMGPEPELVGDYWHGFSTAADAGGDMPRHLQPLAAATILGRCRSKLYRGLAAVLDAGGRIFYCDTDSIHCSLPPERMTEIGRRTGAFSIGQALGQLNPEGGPFRACYLGSKAYAILDDDGNAIKGALKGIPWKQLSDGVVDDVGGVPLYRQARGANEHGTDLRAELFRDVLKRGRVTALREGITTFAAGAQEVRRAERRRADDPAAPAAVNPWRRRALVRTVRSAITNKAIRNSTVWAYRTAAEVFEVRRGTALTAAGQRARAAVRAASCEHCWRVGIEAAGGDPPTPGRDDLDEIRRAVERKHIPNAHAAWRLLFFRRCRGIDTAADVVARIGHLENCAAFMRTLPGWERFDLSEVTLALTLAADDITASESRAALANAATETIDENPTADAIDAEYADPGADHESDPFDFDV